MNAIPFRPEWQLQTEGIVLPETEVHIWAVALEQPEKVIQALVTTLADDEHERMARFAFPHLRREYAAARGAMRAILAGYVGIDAKSLQFAYSPQGKPRLVNGTVRFNLSHSGGIALLAVTRDREIGVDIEHVRPVTDLLQIAQRNFSAVENAALRQVIPDKQVESFFNCWTRKEAYIKALGDGLSYPLDRFDVTLEPGERARLLHVADNPAEVNRWQLMAVSPAEGYIAAVIAEGQDWTPQRWVWDTSRIVA